MSSSKPDSKKRNLIIAVLLSFAVSLIYMYDFYHMVTPTGVENSDTKIQIGYVLEWCDTGHLPVMCQAYPLYYIVIRGLHHFIDNWIAVIMVFCSMWSFVANIVQIILIRDLLRNMEESRDGYNNDSGERYAVLAGTALSFAWPISLRYSFLFGYSLFGCPLEQVFLTSGATALDHNLTYLFVKPFALLAVYLFYRILRKRDNEPVIGCYIALAVTLFVSVIAKPNFYQAFAPAGVIATLAYLKRRGMSAFPGCVMMALSFIPATAWVLYSMRTKLNPYAVSPFEGITIFSDGTPVIIVLIRAIAFCLFISGCYIIYRRRDDLLELGWLIYLFGAGEFILFIEPAEPMTLSMSGGYNISMYILFAMAIVAAWRLFITHRNRKMFIAGNTILAVHAVFGVAVFIVTWIPWWKTWLGI